MTRREGVEADPDSPAALIDPMFDAALRSLSPPAVGHNGHLTPYGELAQAQFREIADRFSYSEGRTVADALAFSFVARNMLSAFGNQGSQERLDWEVHGYVVGILARLHACLQELSGGQDTLPKMGTN